MRVPTIILMLAAGLLATGTGCGPSEVRQDAAVLAANTGSLNNEVESLTKSRRQIESARARLTDGMELSTARAEAFNQRTLAGWTALKGDTSFKARSELFESVRSYTDAAATRDAALDAMSAKAAALGAAAKGTRSDQLAAAAKSLGALSRERSVTDELKFLYGYVKAVQSDLKKAKEDAEKAKTDATDKADGISKRTRAKPRPPVPTTQPV